MPSLARRALALLLVAALAIVAVLVLFGGQTGTTPLVPGSALDNDPLAYTSDREDAFAAAAAQGHAHVIYAKSPGGARASAQRTARYRALVEAAAATATSTPTRSRRSCCSRAPAAPTRPPTRARAAPSG